MQESPAETVPQISSTAAPDQTRIHFAEKYTSAEYWSFHSVFLAVVLVAVIVVLFAKIPKEANNDSMS